MKTQILLLTSIAILGLAKITLAQTVPSNVPTSGLVGYWPFSGNAGDSSGIGNNGIISNATLTNDRFGNPNSAYAFNGSNSSIVFNNAILPITKTSFSINFWFLKNNSNYFSLFSDRFGTGCGYKYSFSVDSFGIVNVAMHIQGPWTVNNVLANVAVGNNSWNMVTGVFDASNSLLTLYLNGVLQNTVGSNIWDATTNPSTLGNVSGCNSVSEHFLNGKIDELRIYNQVLNSNEILGLYQIGCNGTPTAIISADGPTTFCAGNNVNLTISKQFASYQWKKYANNIQGAISPTYSPLTTGIYKCVVTNACGTTTSNSISVTVLPNVSAKLTASGNTSFCAGDSVTLNATNLGVGYSIQWFRTNISMQGATTFSFTAKQPGTYKVVTRNNSNGCSRISAGITTTVNCRIANPNLISVENNSESYSGDKLGEDETDNGISVFPNPNAGSFIVEFAKDDKEDGPATIEIMNTLGKLVYSSQAEITDGHFGQEITLQKNFKSGIYIVNIRMNDEVISSKVLLQ